MNRDFSSQLPVALCFQVTAEQPEGGSTVAASALPHYRLGWVITAGGRPFLTLTYRLPDDCHENGTTSL